MVNGVMNSSEVEALVKEYEDSWKLWKESHDPLHKEQWLRAARQLQDNIDSVVFYIKALRGDLDYVKENLEVIRDAKMSANDAREVAGSILSDLDDLRRKF